MKHLTSKIGVTLLIAFLFCAAACDDSAIEGEIVDAPSGKRNVDVSGKTFVLSEDYTYDRLTLTTSTFSNGKTTDGESELLMVLQNKRITYSFAEDGTFTKTEEILYSDEFEGELTYKQTGKVVDSSDAELYSRASFNTFAKSKKNSYNDIYLNYKDVGYDDDDSKLDYEKFTDTRSFSGYAGNPYKVTEATGTWTSFEEPTDGFDGVTKRYLLKWNKQTITYYESCEVLGSYTTKELSTATSADPLTNEYTDSTDCRLKESYDSTATYTETSNIDDDPYEISIYEAEKDGEKIYVIRGDYYTIKE